MTQHELHHPVTEESAREFVNNTSPSDATDADKDQRTQALLQGAVANNAWRESRDPVERLALTDVPFASHDTEADEDDAAEADEASVGTPEAPTADEGDDTNADA